MCGRSRDNGALVAGQTGHCRPVELLTLSANVAREDLLGAVPVVQGKYEVSPTSGKRGRLRKVIRLGKSSAQANTKARVMLKKGEGWSASQVVEREVTERPVFRISRRRRVGERMSN